MAADRVSSCRSCNADIGRRGPLCWSCRTWSYVERGEGACWLWTGALNAYGYGQISRPGKRGGNVTAHRAIFELHSGGPIPDGLFVLHRCDTPKCVNPAHLFLGTQADNIADMMAKGRCRSRGLSGERNGIAKLNEETVRRIRERYAAGGVSQQQLADEAGVTRAAISAVLTRKNWGHVL